MKTVITLFLCLIFLNACASPTVAPGAVQTAIAQTQSVQPTTTIQSSPTPVFTVTPAHTTTPTVISLAALDLEPIIVKPGDLPAGYSAAQVSNILPAMFSKAIQPDKSYYLQFARNNESAGGVTIMLFDKFPNDLNVAFDLVASGMGKSASPIPMPGQKALTLSFESGLGLKATEILFVECQALVHIRFVGTSDDRVSSTYAERLDQRLKPLVCRKK